MDLGLRDKVAWVAGGSQGLGFAVAEALAAAGARVALGARGEAGLNEAANRLEAATGRRPFVHALDMGNAASILAWTEACREALGPAAILLSNSGGPPAGGFRDLDTARWREAADLILHGAVTLTEAALPDMEAAGWGRIVFITSVSVRQPIPNLTLSNTLRPAVLAYSRSLADELGPQGITVNCVAPGYTRTERLQELARALAEREGREVAEIEAAWLEQVPLGRLGEPREVAAAALWLASEAASYVTGQLLTVDGGLARSLH